MHGLGNDFAVFDGVSQPVSFSPAEIRALADRHTGIGFDQLLVVAKPSQPDVDFDYKIYNADGTEVAQCGNGARCIARFIHQQGLSNQTNIIVATTHSKMQLVLQPDDSVAVNMGVPELKPQHTLEVANLSLRFAECDLGNPHAVTIVDDVVKAPVQQVGEALQHHSAFPQQVNVGFMQVVSPSRVKLRVFERGAGETQACGSGACAAVVAGRQFADLSQQVEVELLGGKLYIEWLGAGQPVWMRGTATTVYEGILP